MASFAKQLEILRHIVFPIVISVVRGPFALSGVQEVFGAALAVPNGLAGYGAELQKNADTVLEGVMGLAMSLCVSAADSHFNALPGSVGINASSTGLGGY